jgi:hypothetical protein
MFKITYGSNYGFSRPYRQSWRLGRAVTLVRATNLAARTSRSNAVAGSAFLAGSGFLLFLERLIFSPGIPI